MRKGEAFLYSLAMQLLLVTLVMGGLLFTKAVVIVDADILQQRAAAHDNALLAEALLSVPNGTMRAAYLLGDEEYVVRLSEHSVTTQDASVIGNGVRVRYAGEADITITPTEFQPQMYEWVKTRERLSIDAAPLARTCPDGAPSREWTSASASGEPIAQHVLENALREDAIEVEYTDRIPLTPDHEHLRIETSTEETVSIIHSPAHIEPFGCLLRQELVRQGFTAQSQAAPDVRGVFIMIPQDADTDRVVDALSCGYRRYLGHGC